MYQKSNIRRYGVLLTALIIASGLGYTVFQKLSTAGEQSVGQAALETPHVSKTTAVSVVEMKRERGVTTGLPSDLPYEAPAETRKSVTRSRADQNSRRPALSLTEAIPFDFATSKKLELSKNDPSQRSARGEDIEDDDDHDGGPHGDHPGEAQHFRNLQLQDDDGKIPVDGLQKAREQVERMRARQQKKAVAAGKPGGLEIAGINPGVWAWLGPGNIGGRIRSIVISPADSNSIWVGSVSGGIWHTTDAGVGWTPVNDFMSNLAVSTMVINPTNPNIMYAGTGEGYTLDQTGNGFTPDAQRGDGVFKSTDAGITWTQLPSTNTANPAVCPIAPCPWWFVNRLTISPDGSTILAGTESGIMQSVDGGTTWTRRNAGLTRYPDIDFDPSSSQRAVAAGYTASVFSTDGGQTWQAATYTPAITLGGSSGRIEMAYAPSNPSIVYAMIDATQGNGNPPPGGSLVKGNLYKSLDGGATFNQVNASFPGNTLLGGQGDYGNIIWVNPQDPNFLIAGGIILSRSTDGGANWSAIASGGNGSAHNDHHMIVADPGFNNTTNKRAYFSNDGGLYRADDVSSVSDAGGWTNLNNNLGVTQFYGASINTAGTIIGGTQDNGTLRYTGNAQAWTTMFAGDGGYTAADMTDNNYFYSEYVNLGIVRSTDGGSTSGYIYCNPAPTSGNGGPCIAPATGLGDAFNGANFIAPILLDPSEPNRLYGGGLSLWRSNDIKSSGLPAWAAVKVPAPDIRPANLGQPNPISAITVAKNNSDFVLVGHNDGQIYLTFDGTSAAPIWSRIDTPIPAKRFVTRITLDEQSSPNRIYVTFGGFANDNVYRSLDLGVTWTDITGPAAGGLPSVPVRDLAISPAVSTNLYVATEIGVFASDDMGVTWGLPQDGPVNVSVDQLMWIDGGLAAVTHGRGIYKTSIPVYVFGLCAPPPGCMCYGDWDCPCTWNSHHVPTIDEDIAIVCPVWLKAGLSNGGKTRNLSINNNLTIDNNLSAVFAMSNMGHIFSTPGAIANIGAKTFSNSRPPNVLSLAGIIEIQGGITVSGDALNSGILALGGSFNSANLTTNPESTLTTPTVVNVSGNLENSGLIQTAGAINVKGNIGNSGTLKGAFLVPTVPTLAKTYSGFGTWDFGAFSIPLNHTINLGSNVTFKISSLFNNGTLDFKDKTMTFLGSTFQSGNTLGTGVLKFAPLGGNAIFNGNGPGVTVANGTVEYQSGGTISGPFKIDTGATFAMNTGGLLTVNGDVTVDGSLVKTGINPQFVFNGQTFTNNGVVGNIDFFTFNDNNGPVVQTLQGVGSWSPTNIQVGGGTATRLALNTDVTFSTNQLATATGASIDVGNLTLTMTGPTNFFRGVIKGTGLVKMAPASGTPNLGLPLTIDPALEIASGTVKSGGATVNGNVTVDAGATLSLFNFTGLAANGDLLNNGNITAFSGNPTLAFNGVTFTNNGSVVGNVNVNFGTFFGPVLNQNLAGTGSWAGSPRLLFDSLSNTTMLSDVTYAGGNLFVEGKLNTGAFTLSVPCTTLWSGSGDVVGNVRRTNLAACPGAAVAFGNPFTTIQFTSGVAPTEVTVQMLPGPPAGFPNAVNRNYVITPTGGSGYTATLRLHYLDSELNGNNEAALQLFRNNGSNWNLQGVTSRNTTQNWVEFTGVTQFSPWTVSSNLAPTAAAVSLSGRVTDALGYGIRDALLTITSSDGSTRMSRSNAFGYYRFDTLGVGETYILSISSKRYSFVSPTRPITLFDHVTGEDFVAVP